MNREAVERIFSNIPALDTKRLILRRMLRSDAADMYEYARLPEVTRHLTWRPHPDYNYTCRYLEYLEKRYNEGKFYDWAIVYKENSKMIGTCGFTHIDFENNWAEVGYVLNPNYWGMGIAAEALSRVIKFGFLTLNLHRIESRYMIGNDRSRRVMEKCNMTYEGTFRDAMYIFGEYKTIGVYSILSSDYINSYFI